MGASDSKLVFKKGIFRLSEERHIPADDSYWTSVRRPDCVCPVLGDACSMHRRWTDAHPCRPC